MSTAACGVCRDHPYKYKCPTCQLPYCSVQCYRSHKPVHSDTTKTPGPHSADPKVDGSASQPPRPQNPFAILAARPELDEVFRLHPQLAPALEELYKATLPPEQGGTFIPKPSRDRQAPRPWKQESADNFALRRLQNIRQTASSEGEAMTDFVTVVKETIEKAHQGDPKSSASDTLG